MSSNKLNDNRRNNSILLKIFFFFIVGISIIHSQEKVIFVNYGPESPQNSGDYYYRQLIHFKVPIDFSGDTYVRFFDLACGGIYDSKYGETCSEFEVVLYKNFVDENLFPSGLKFADLSNEKKVISKNITEDGDYLNTWKTFAKLSKSDGTEKDGYRYYSISIKGLTGNDANGFDVFLSSSESENININSAEIFSLEPTFRFQKRAPRVTFRIRTDNSESSYNVRNFDFDNIDLGYSTLLKKFTVIYGSDDGTWNSARFSLGKHEVGNDIGISIGPNYSSKIENDLVFSVQDSQNKKLSILYPPTEYVPETFPKVNTQLTYLDDCKRVEFRADNSADLSGHALNAKWFFEDGSELEGLVVSKTFENTGKFSPELLLFNTSNEIARAIVIKVPVTINIPPTAIAGGNKIAAPNEIILFDASNSTDIDGKITKYIWDLGDGTITSGVRVRHSYDKPGIYSVKLKVEDNFSASPCRFSESNLQVIINDKPIANTKTELIGATDEILSFSDNGSYDNDGNIIEYKWDFGTFGIKYGENVTNSFPTPGVYKVKFSIQDNSSAKNDYDTKEVTVKINFPPDSRPGGDRVAAINETLIFDGSQSSDKDGFITKYEWDFGDGNVAEGISVSHNYQKSGTYTVKLIVTDNSTTKTAVTSSTLSVVVNEPPVAVAGENQFLRIGITSFDASNSHDSDGVITKYLWDFGDGKKSEGIRANHIYTEPGEYPVTLKVIDNSKTSNNFGTSSLIVKINAKPISKPGEDLIVATNQMFNLSGSNSYDSDGKIVKYSWSLGNEILSNEVSFQHQFTKPGLYQIGLMVQDDFPIPDYDFKSISVLVNTPPKAIITAPTKGMVSSPIKFDAGLSSDFEGEISEYLWSFSDGTSERGKIINKTFSKSGYYDVELKVTDKQNVSNSSSITNTTIFVNSRPSAITTTSIKSCDKIIALDASSSVDAEGDPLSYIWNFYDGSQPKEGVTVQHNFKQPGIYPILLTVDDNHKLPNSRYSIQTIIEINAPPIAIIGSDTTICTGDILILNGLYSKDPEGGLLKYEWMFDDGQTMSGESVLKTWKKSGVYQVTLKVTDNSGLPCSTSFDSKLITVIESPVADAGDDITTCVNTPIYFDGSKSTDIDGVVDAYEWDFGDGEFGSGAKPIHIYKEVGTYKVKLIITGSSNGKCDNKGYDELLITVNEGPIANFTAKDSVAKGETIYFDASPSTSNDATIISYEWDFADGSTSDGRTVSHIFNKSGNYLVRLKIKTDSQNECNQTMAFQNIFVNDGPIAKAGENLSVSASESFMLDASKSYDNDGNISEYKWEFSNGDIRYGKIIEHSISQSGNYSVTLTVTDNTTLSNNKAEDKLFILVNAPPSAIIESVDKAYQNTSVLFDASNSFDVDGDLLSYEWYINNQKIESDKAVLHHEFFFPGIYNIKLGVKDNSGFASNYSLTNKQIEIVEFPKISIGADTIVCLGNQIQIKPILSANTISAPQIEWRVNDELLSTSFFFNYNFLKSGEFLLVASLYDRGYSDNSISTDSLKIQVNDGVKPIVLADRVEYIGAANDVVLFDVTNYFRNYSSLTFNWDFGDKNFSQGAKVRHTYDKPGNYIVTLKVDDGGKTNCSSITTKFKVTIKRR